MEEASVQHDQNAQSELFLDGCARGCHSSLDTVIAAIIVYFNIIFMK